MNKLELGQIVFHRNGWMFMVIDKGSYDGTANAMRMICYENECSVHRTVLPENSPFLPFVKEYEVDWLFVGAEPRQVQPDPNTHKPPTHIDHTMIAASAFLNVVLLKVKEPTEKEGLID